MKHVAVRDYSDAELVELGVNAVGRRDVDARTKMKHPRTVDGLRRLDPTTFDAGSREAAAELLADVRRRLESLAPELTERQLEDWTNRAFAHACEEIRAAKTKGEIVRAWNSEGLAQLARELYRNSWLVKLAMALQNFRLSIKQPS